jgi:CheY-specific phosphatase CheX
MLEKLEAVAALIGAIGTICGLLSALLPDGKAKKIARDLGFRLGDASRELRKK